VWTFGFPSNGDHAGILVIAPLGEELGWRGLLQRRLERRHSGVVASAVVGVAWVAWHAPMWLGHPPAVHDVVVGAVTIFFGAFVFAALFRKSGGSVWVVVAAHAGVHLDNTSRIGGAALDVTCAAFFVAACCCAAWLHKTDAGTSSRTSSNDKP
jgi:membrane protease YdiL (CAAX protease family)